MDHQLDVVEYLDPEWRDHFREVADAYEFYQTHSFREFRTAYYEVTGEEWHNEPMENY